MLSCVSDPDPGGELFLERTHITAVLGEDVYLGCRYVGESKIESAQWKHKISSKANSKVKSKKRLAGFVEGKPFSRDDFSKPDSVTNLTVRMNVSSVEAEGEYICEFESDEDNYSESVFLTVVGKSSQ